MRNKETIQAFQYANEKGFTLVSILDTQTLPPILTESIIEQGITLEKFPRLMVLANGGSRFWEVFSEDRPDVEHPVDHFSIQVTDHLFETYFPGINTIRLYPQAFQLPIQQLSRFAEWSFASPMGMDIHPVFGLWYAYRTIYLVGAEIPLFNDTYTDPPCDSCQEKPCFAACPSGAVRGMEKFDTNTCITYRLSANSKCAETCLARMACPVGAQYRYSPEQMSFHYLYSLHAYQRYYAEKKEPR